MKDSVSTLQSDLARQKRPEAAFAEICRQGSQAASLTQILADTGLTKGALYRRFQDQKQRALTAVGEVIRPRLESTMFGPLSETKPPLDGLQAMLAAKATEIDPMVLVPGCPLNKLMQEMSPVDETFRLGTTEGVLAIRTRHIFKNSEGKWNQGHHHGSLNDPELPACHHPGVLVRR